MEGPIGTLIGYMWVESGQEEQVFPFDWKGGELVGVGVEDVAGWRPPESPDERVAWCKGRDQLYLAVIEVWAICDMLLC